MHCRYMLHSFKNLLKFYSALLMYYALATYIYLCPDSFTSVLRTSISWSTYNILRLIRAQYLEGNKSQILTRTPKF